MKNRKALSGLIVAFIVSVLCVGNVFAADVSNRVTVGQNYYGDVLLGQIYQTQWNYTTKIKVINTSNTVAVVAKVVFRSAACSKEVLDFFIYLTPTDMWEAQIRLNDKGQPEVYSTDDSVLASPYYTWDGTAACNPFKGVWATEPNAQGIGAFRTPFQDAPAGDTNIFGHIEIHGLAAYAATAPLSKDTLAMAYGNILGVPQVDIAGLIACDFNLNGPAVDVPNILTGVISLENSGYKQSASINMTALENWSNTPIISVHSGLATSLSNSVYNTVPETEAALAKTEYAIPFDFSPATGYSDIVAINTLPTHYIRGTGSRYFTSAACSDHALTGLMYYVYDMKETQLMKLFSPLTFDNWISEVTMRTIKQNIQRVLDAGYVKGWVQVTFPTSTAPASNAAKSGWTVNYTGVPVINSYINVSQAFDLGWSYAASPEATVTYTDTVNNLTYTPRQ